MKGCYQLTLKGKVWCRNIIMHLLYVCLGLVLLTLHPH